ncbi:MAG: hypothetical protein RL444_457 [Verrucomicrobiota bacterium]|jgi:hypothetical protein
MAAFFRGLLLFLFGALVGASGILFLTPSFQVEVRRGDTAIKPVDLGARVAVAPPAPAAPAPTPTKAAAAPATTVAVKPAAAPSAPAAPTTPVTAGSSVEPTLDFAAISRHLVLWPTAVTVKKPTTVSVVEGQKPKDLALEAGALLQLTRVLPNGQLEVRAKGSKFEIASTATDFAAELGKRVSELVAKGTKFDSPYPAATPVPEPAPSAPVAVAPAPVVVVPKGPLTLAQRIDVLYGRKAPEPEATPAPAPAPAAPTATPSATPSAAPSPATPAAAAPAATPEPVVAPAPAPTTREAAKAEEKGKDLDRKMNQLFK